MVYPRRLSTGDKLTAGRLSFEGVLNFASLSILPVGLIATKSSVFRFPVTMSYMERIHRVTMKRRGAFFEIEAWRPMDRFVLAGLAGLACSSGVKQAFRVDSRVVPPVGKWVAVPGKAVVAVKFRLTRVRPLASWGFPDAPAVDLIVYR